MNLRLTLGAKVFSGFLVVLACFGAAAALSTWQLLRINGHLRENESYLRVALSLADLENTQDLLKRMVASGERSPLGLGILKKARLANLDKARRGAQAAGNRELASRVDELEREMGDLGDEKRETRILHDIRTLHLDVTERVLDVSSQVEREGSRLLWGALLLVTIVTLVGAAVTARVHQSLRPLRELMEHVEAFGHGDLGKRVAVRTFDEVGELGRTFNAMADAIEDREKRLIRSERLAAMGNLAAQITHEIRNPLSSIGLNAELLDEELGKNATATKLIGAIRREVDRLTEITEGYLRFARLPPPKLESEDLGQITASLADFVKEECSRQKVDVKIESQPVPVKADRNQLRQAILNLVRNAREAMPSGGILSLEVAAQDRWAILKVSDTGPGIAPEHSSKLFEPFFSTKDDGTGLGLALTHQIVTQHGGQIDLESAPGRGATFVIRLPHA